MQPEKASITMYSVLMIAAALVLSGCAGGKGFRMEIATGNSSNDGIRSAAIENQQAIEMAKIFSDILSGMMNAYASVISNNLNVVMKFLTAVTIVLMLPTLVASIYGMNIALPFQGSPFAFAITMGLSFLLSGTVVFIFIKKRMF